MILKMSELELERADDWSTARSCPRLLTAFPLRAEKGQMISLGAVTEGGFEFLGI